MSSLNGKSAFPENHPLALGAANGFSRSKMVDHFLKKADLVFGIGTSFTISKFITPIPAGKTLAQVTIDESDISKDYPTSYGVIGDAKGRPWTNDRRGQEASGRKRPARRRAGLSLRYKRSKGNTLRNGCHA